ncbi:MAG: DUF86 domain-containing protein [Bacillota bacterium]
MGGINISLIGRKISDIQESMAVLLRYAEREDSDFLSDEDAIRSAKYVFIVLVEAATSIAAHLCAKIVKKVPATYADTYFLLSENGVLESELAANLAKMARFRNLLVHGYASVDNRKMLEIMRGNLGDLNRFFESVQRVLGS